MTWPGWLSVAVAMFAARLLAVAGFLLIVAGVALLVPTLLGWLGVALLLAGAAFWDYCGGEGA